jgi:poly(A)-specific ribonuclease
LQGFQNAIHELFPKIVDTKYLATHAEGDLNASPTLQEIAEGLSDQHLPVIVTHPDHSKYQEKEAFHEAGYDSLLTATIMLRLAAKLGAQRNKDESAAQPHPNAPKDGRKPSKETNGDLQDFVRDGREKVVKPVPLPPVDGLDDGVTGRQKRRKNRKKGKQSKEVEERSFQSKNIFDSLREMRLGPDDAAESSSHESEPALEFDDAEASVAWDEKPAAEAGSWENDGFVQDKTGWVPIEQSERHAMELIPKFDSDFWKEFGNTLRVFGTQEAVLKIADW